MADPRSKELNMLDGPILPRILQFTLPLAATGMLQLLFNAADVIVVGKFSGSIALAAVGATSTLVNLIVNTFIGISVGVNILVARRIGCHDADGVSRASHCAVALSALLGLLVMAIGLLFSRPMLEWMETPADILEKSTLYLKLYFLGVPFTLIYNFGAAILRAYGDTRRPLIYLTVSGVVNALLNLFFVIVCAQLRQDLGCVEDAAVEVAFSVRLHGERAEHGQVTEGTHSLERGHALGQAHERLDDDEVDACGKQRLSLFGVEVQQTVIRAIFAGENRLAGGRHVSRDERVRADGLARERDERAVQRLDLMLQPVVR